MAYHGHTEPQDSATAEEASASSSISSLTEAGNELTTISTPSGIKVDPEKGCDLYLVDWYGPNDPENPQNWSHFKKVFVTFEICLITFSV